MMNDASNLTRSRACRVVFAALLVGSCARPVWVKPGATASDFEVAKGRCLASAYSQVPSAPTVATFGGGYQSPMITNCTAYGNSANCFTTGGQYTPPISVPYDANAGVRTEVYQGCMYADGWSLQRQQADVAQPGPASPPPESDWTKGLKWGVQNGASADCDAPPSSIGSRADWTLGCQAANSDWAKGVKWGYQNRQGAACDVPPADIASASSWTLGCRLGQKPPLERGLYWRQIVWNTYRDDAQATRTVLAQLRPRPAADRR